eukprot:CAMPEP_0198295114 /NCGR_PEP_ID=MMETSP1449-20131203/25954_1 /TAXON_ID=420275 /ORGANISM="Attheya septentrionalis, Strain CCMP2084" /LENGTH=229 /DNA_ID=CAMNT_0043995309 /DNA_START=34 /DNA_END=723 /DNA_ORIENTATION=+
MSEEFRNNTKEEQPYEERNVSHEQSDGSSSLRRFIDFPRVNCLNESTHDGCKKILKPVDKQLTPEPYLSSQQDDAELLLHIPFTESVTIESISIHSHSTGQNNTFAPRIVKLFLDRENFGFETARELLPAATLELSPPREGFVSSIIDYPLSPAGRFQNVSLISLFFVSNASYNAESRTQLSFVGFNGKGTHAKREAPEWAVYEAFAHLEDHDVHKDGIKAQEGLGDFK